MSYTVIFSNTYDLSKVKLPGDTIMFTKKKIVTSTDAIQVLPIMSIPCGLKIKTQRPDRVIIEEPEVIPEGYKQWIVRKVIPVGCNGCTFSYVKSFSGMDFSKFVKDNLGGTNETTFSLL